MLGKGENTLMAHFELMALSTWRATLWLPKFGPQYLKNMLMAKFTLLQFKVETSWHWLHNALAFFSKENNKSEKWNISSSLPLFPGPLFEYPLFLPAIGPAAHNFCAICMYKKYVHPVRVVWSHTSEADARVVFNVGYSLASKRKFVNPDRLSNWLLVPVKFLINHVPFGIR